MHDARAVDPHQRRARFDVAGVRARRLEPVLEHAVRAGEDRFQIRRALHAQQRALNVRMRALGPRPVRVDRIRVLRPAGMQRGRIRRQRRGGIEYRRPHVVVHDDLARRRFGRFASLGRNRGYPVADEAHRIDREHRPVEDLPPQTRETDVGAGEHHAHAGHAPRRFDVDRADARVRVRAFGIRGPERVFADDVGGILRLP